MTLKVIAYARNGHTDKFGIPRQSREESPILTRIVFEPEYSIPEALRGIEGYSHLWLIWGFSEVRRTDVRCTKENGSLELIVSGADLMDGTPIYDIKPYLSFSDSHPEAQNGFAEETKDRTLRVVFDPAVYTELPPRLLRDAPEKEISYILSQDPRPAYQDDPDREYKMDYAGYRVIFTVKETTVTVKKIEKI